MSVYATDDFKVTDSLTVNVGVRWDWFGLPTEKNGRRTRQYFNNRQDQNDPQTALLSPFGGFGNLGRNVLRGPSQKRFDLGLSKITRFSERAELELRWDIFNLFNFVNFANPNADLQDQSDFGQITRTVGGARTMQFGTKLRF